MMKFIMETVHLEDMEKLAGLVTEEYYKKRLESNPNDRLKIRVVSKVVLALVNIRLTEEVKQKLKENWEWIWGEINVIIVEEVATSGGDKFLYTLKIQQKLAKNRMKPSGLV